jgi:hypothetical protein
MFDSLVYNNFSEPPAELLAEVFPWIEREQAALQSRIRANTLSNDMALKQFLRLLIWLRKVLIQDAAILFTQDPNCPIFQYSVFRSASFRTFAAGSQLALADAEEKARLAFENLPGHLVRSLRGVLTDTRMEQQQDREEHRLQLSAMEERFTRVEVLLETLVGSKGRRRGGKTGERFLFPFLFFFSLKYVPCTALPPLSLPPAFSPAPPLPLALPALPSTITINLSGSPSSPVTATAHTTYSPPSQPIFPAPSPPSSSVSDPVQEQRWADLLARFDETQLRRHAWDWVAKDKDWLPIYKYQPVTDISDIWVEWAEGVDGFLSVRDLTERWGARWRRNDAGQRTESSRRKKVIDLVTELSSKHLWNVNLTLRFLRDRYEPKYKARSFCDYLTKENKGAVLQAAMSYAS